MMNVLSTPFPRTYTWRDVSFLAELLPSRPGYVEHVTLYALPRRVWSFSLTHSDEVLAALASVPHPTAFLIEDPRDDTQYDVALDPATGNGSRTVFSLPTTGASSRYYAKPGTGVATANGAIVSATFDVDARTVTYAAAPTNGHAVKASFVPLRCVRLAEPADWSSLTSIHAQVRVEIEEIFRGS